MATSRRCSAFRCTWHRARWSPSSAPMARANRRCSTASPAPSGRVVTRSCSTVSRLETRLRMLWSGAALRSVEENLLIGGQVGRSGPWNLARIYDLFPVLAERRQVPSTSLSGGQQQMVAIGRALMSNPKLLLCDEISLGLAPIVVREVYARLPSIVAEGSSLIIVEQDIVQALKAASHVYCLQEGRVALTGSAGTLTREAISAAYFGA